MSHETEIQIIAALVAAGCAIPGTFLALRAKAMITDSVSHSILPGIAAGFLITGNLSSPLLILGAFAAAAASVFSSEALSRSRHMSNDSSIALVYPFFFSAGVIMISQYAGNAHLDADSVLLGELAFAPFDRLVVSEKDIGPVSLYSSGAIFLLNAVFAAIFYKELKFSSFDPLGAKCSGFGHPALSLSFYALVCATCVVSFNSVGSVLLIAFIATPVCCALLLADSLGRVIAVSVSVAACASLAGFHLAVAWNTNIAGAITTALGAAFILLLAFAPRKGILSRIFERRRWKVRFATALVLEHLAASDGRQSVEAIRRAMMWEKGPAEKTLRRAEEKRLVKRTGQTVHLTQTGQNWREFFRIAGGK